MRKRFIYGFFCLLPFAPQAQNCAEMYDYFKKGVTLEYTIYDDKGKVTGINTQRVTEVSQKADTLIASFALTNVNSKNKEQYKSTFPMKCYNGSVYLDMRSMVPAQSQKESTDMQMEFKGTDQVFPNSMEVGQSLPDANMEMTMRMGGMQLLNTQYFIKNRKVEAREEITTTAGTFKCLRISYDFEYKLMGTRTTHTLYWYSPSVGMVKSISYDKKGKEESRMELTKFVK